MLALLPPSTQRAPKLTLTSVSDMAASLNYSQANWHYRYNLLDETPDGTADRGLFSPHTHELYTIWGRNATDGGDPGCFALPSSDPLSCTPALDIVQSYWISFVRTLDPNTLKLPDAPTWESWSVTSPRRIVLNSRNATMETQGEGVGEWEAMGLNQRERCLQLMGPLAKSVAMGLSQGQAMPVFANGTRSDPRLVVANATGLLNGASPVQVSRGVKADLGKWFAVVGLLMSCSFL